MKVWEALQVLEKMDPNVEVTLGFMDYSKKNTPRTPPSKSQFIPMFGPGPVFNDWKTVQ